MGPRSKVIAAGATCVLAALTMVWLQQRFQAGDEKSALALVLEYRAHGGPSLPEILAERHPEQPITWSTATESGCLERVRVAATVSATPGASSRSYGFVVELGGPAIHPGNELGRDAMRALDGPGARAAR
ncbi:MAG: hypothetical protein IT373_26200 [Polyangiaceae bacterium]|nr:hypothetical protein [Polyangiaceae bacterium]